MSIRTPLRPIRPWSAFAAAATLAVAGPVAVAQAAVYGADAAGPTVHFPGLPVVGALFGSPDYTGANAAHFCTGTVVDSPRGNLVLTAAHCVWDASAGTYMYPSITFAPGYDGGPNPSLGGVWDVTSIEVAPGYVADGDPEDDYAFLVIAPRDGVEIESTTGALRLAQTRLPEGVNVVGYNDTQFDPDGNEPIVCHALASEETDDAQPWARFDCPNYQDGTSGGPWITDDGSVVGVIGGYEQGGDSPDTSYSALFDSATLAFYRSVAD